MQVLFKQKMTRLDLKLDFVLNGIFRWSSHKFSPYGWYHFFCVVFRCIGLSNQIPLIVQKLIVPLKHWLLLLLLLFREGNFYRKACCCIDKCERFMGDWLRITLAAPISSVWLVLMPKMLWLLKMFSLCLISPWVYCIPAEPAPPCVFVKDLLIWFALLFGLVKKHSGSFGLN